MDMFSTVSDAIRGLLGQRWPEVTLARDHFPDDRHRLSLEYWWDETRPPLIVIGQNPSKATRNQGDPTVTRCARRAARMGLGGLVMTNMFAYIATHPEDMWAQPTDGDMQARNLATIQDMLDTHPLAPILYAPGGDSEPRHAAAMAQIEAITAVAGRSLLCLGTTATGYPRHPSRTGYDVATVAWTGRPATATGSTAP